MMFITFIRRVFRKLYSVVATLFFKEYLRRQNKISQRKVSRKNGPIISVTSYNKRFDILYLTLESLMRQDYDGDYQIVVTLSEVDIGLYGGLPANLEALMLRGVRIIRVQENIKSYKKAFYVSDENINFPIITIDDDILYPRWWLSEMLQSAKSESGCVLAFRGHHILRGADDIIFDYGLWFKFSDQLTSSKPTYSFLPTGTSGVYYPVGSLKGLLSTKKDFLSICPNADDLWLKYITTLNGFKAKRIRNKNLHFLCSDLSSSLHTINVHNGGNDVQFNGISKYSETFKSKILSDAMLFNGEVKGGAGNSMSDQTVSH